RTKVPPTPGFIPLPPALITAQVFSNPPINTATVRKQGQTIVLSDSVRWPAKAVLAPLPDGPSPLGIRPHHISPVAKDRAATPLDGQVQIAELSGSESTIHFLHGWLQWVSQSHGMHAVGVRPTLPLFLHTDHAPYVTV